MIAPATEDEELQLQEEFDELDLYDAEEANIVHEMTDWVQFELDN